MGDWTCHGGHAQGNVFNRETGVIMGGADPQGEGIALARQIFHRCDQREMIKLLRGGKSGLRTDP